VWFLFFFFWVFGGGFFFFFFSFVGCFWVFFLCFFCGFFFVFFFFAVFGVFLLCVGGWLGTDSCPLLAPSVVRWAYPPHLVLLLIVCHTPVLVRPPTGRVLFSVPSPLPTGCFCQPFPHVDMRLNAALFPQCHVPRLSRSKTSRVPAWHPLYSHAPRGGLPRFLREKLPLSLLPFFPVA